MPDKKDNFLIDIISGIFFLVFCIFLYFKNIKLSADSRLFPGIIIWALALCSISLIVKALYNRYLNKKKSRIGHNNKKRKPIFTREMLKYEFLPIVFYLLVIIFIILLPLIGFEFAAFIFMVTGMWLINKEQLKRSYYLTVLIPAILVFLFRVMLNISLPVNSLLASIFGY